MYVHVDISGGDEISDNSSHLEPTSEQGRRWGAAADSGETALTNKGRARPQ